MANSSVIGAAKNLIIKEFIKDNDIVQAIDADDIDSDSLEKLVGTHIFNYNQNPYTINTVLTFITIQINIPQSFGMRSNTYVHPTIEVWIISHEKHMVVDNIPKITENRNDYLSKLIDKRLNGRSDIGLGKVSLLSNVEGSFQKDYLYRKLVFECTDLNNSRCFEE